MDSDTPVKKWRVYYEPTPDGERWYSDNGPGVTLKDIVVLGPYKTEHAARLAVEARLLTDRAEIQSMELELTRKKVSALGDLISRLEKARDGGAFSLGGPEMKVPKGWRVVTRGRIRWGDRLHFEGVSGWHGAICSVGCRIKKNRVTVIRPVKL